MPLVTSLVAGGLTGLGLYAALVEPRRPQLTHRELRVPRWPAALDGYTILHLSDLHTRGSGPLERFVQSLPDRLPLPDLVAVTGDFAEGQANLAACLAALRPLRARQGCYAVLGNNDFVPRSYRTALTDGLAAQGIRVLEDQCVRLGEGDAAFALGGLLYYFVWKTARQFTYPVAEVFRDAPDGLPRVLLAHSPDPLPEAAAAGVSLLLAGHTHGGQMCLPGGHPPYCNLYRPELRPHLSGVTRRDETVLFVSRGLGLSAPLFRLFCRPEAALLTLRSA